MIFKAHQVEPPLARHVESIFHFKDFVPDHSIERLVPTGHAFLLFELDGMTRHTYDNRTLDCTGSYQNTWFSGMHRNYKSISAHKNSEMFVIQFKPAGALPFIHQPLHLFNETIQPAEGVFGEGVLSLRAAILEAPSTDEKFSLAETWLLDRFDDQFSVPEQLETIIAQFQTEPAENYPKVVDAYPHSQKHLIDQFKKYIGLTPKYYQRILRFNDLLLKIQAQETVNWTDVAYQCGFSDQSHFIKEFQHFSGFNPSEFLSKDLQHAPANFFPLDKG